MNVALATALEELLIGSSEEKTRRQYEEALASLRKYPLDVNTPQDLLKLTGFNRQLSKKLFDLAGKSNAPVTDPVPVRTTRKRKIEPVTKRDDECFSSKNEPTKPTKKRRKKEDDSEDEKENDDGCECYIDADTRGAAAAAAMEQKRKRKYVPKKGSSSYALILGLFDAEAWKEESAVEKTELIEKAKPHSDVALEPPDCQKPATVFRPKQFYFYSGWGTIKTLIGNGLVLAGKRKGSRKTVYYLSVDGVILAQKLMNA